MKKTISVLLALTMALTMGATGFASTPAAPSGDVEIVNLSENISSQSIAEIKESVSARFVLEDGTVVPIDSVVTIQDVPTSRIRSFAVQDTKTYAVSVQASASKLSTDMDELFEDGAGVDAYLGMEWTDNLGTDNTLDYIWGGRSLHGGATVSGASLRYKCGSVDVTKSVTNRSFFTYFPNATGWSMYSNYNIVLSGIGTLYLKVVN